MGNIVYLGNATPNGGSGGGSITVDDALSTTSTNPVQNAIVTEAINGINAKIPVQASSQNQLADKDFVNSSIATNTANFIGTFTSLEDLLAYSGTLTNNDYAFVSKTDASGNLLYDRYKYNGTTWVFEYELNNSSFTAAQFAALNSGATTTNIGQIATNASNISDLQAQAGSATLTTTAQTLSGAINELNANTPTIGNATITLTQGGVTKGSFTVNQSTDTSIDLDAGGAGGIQNTAKSDGSVTIIGVPADHGTGWSVNIGYNSQVNDSAGTVIGSYAQAGYNSVAIGSGAIAQGSSAIQIGNGVNSEEYTFYVGGQYTDNNLITHRENYKMLDLPTGKIPNDRIEGATGSFTSQDGKTITVTNGVITSIV